MYMYIYSMNKFTRTTERQTSPRMSEKRSLNVRMDK